MDLKMQSEAINKIISKLEGLLNKFINKLLNNKSFHQFLLQALPSSYMYISRTPNSNLLYISSRIHMKIMMNSTEKISIMNSPLIFMKISIKERVLLY